MRALSGTAVSGIGATRDASLSRLFSGLLMAFGTLTMIAAASGSGYVLTTTLFHEETSAVRGIVGYMVLPAVTVGGLLIFAVGFGWRLLLGRRRRGGGDGGWHVDPRKPGQVLGIAFFAIIVVSSLGVAGASGFRSIEFMDSSTFCTTCHTVMNPQIEAYELSSHAEVNCTTCHIAPDAGPLGPNLDAYVKVKLGGLRQTLAVLTDSYHQPVRAEPEKIPGASRTCVECHPPGKDYGFALRVYRSYLPDESNSRHTRSLAFRVGGGDLLAGPNIHWHATARVFYQTTDTARQVVSWARVEDDDGSEEWVNPEISLVGEVEEPRLMDCIDCHNRVGHRIPGPGELIDAALEEGRVDAELPYLKREAMRLLGGDAAVPPEVLARRFETAGWFEQLRGFYEENYPDIAERKQAQIDAAIEELEHISEKIVDPKMKAGWLTYPDNDGHKLPEGLASEMVQSNGCFRCHGTLVSSETGEQLAGTMGGEGCLKCHGFETESAARLNLQDVASTEACALCHVQVTDLNELPTRSR